MLSNVIAEASTCLPNSCFLTHRRISGDLIAMFKITHGLLEFPMASTMSIQPARGYAAASSPFGLSHF